MPAPEPAPRNPDVRPDAPPPPSPGNPGMKPSEPPLDPNNGPNVRKPVKTSPREKGKAPETKGKKKPKDDKPEEGGK